jgi:protein KTI12
MPLVIICGPPCTGKTTRAHKLYDYLKNELKKQVHLVNEESLQITKNEGYGEPKTEKSTRSSLKSAVERFISKDAIVILDSLNYIKGYRYEIFCLARSAETPHCVIYCNVPFETARVWNSNRAPIDKWDEKLMEDLERRFEVPNSRNRWERPLFTVGPNDDLPLKEIAEILSSKPQNVATIATKHEKISDPNYLYDLDKVTQDIINTILEVQNSAIAPVSDNITVPNSSSKVRLARKVGLAELRRLRRQYIALAKQLYYTQNEQRTQSIHEIAEAFVSYLNTNLSL